MKPLRWLAAGLLWILAGLLGVVGALLCVTIVLLPLGIPAILLARRLFSMSTRLLVPRKARHPVEHAGKLTKKRRKDAGKMVEKGSKRARRKLRKRGLLGS
jgi:hypothetical protein